MAIPTLPNIAPGMSSKKTTTFRVLVADFGDGYGQSVPDGLNSQVDSWDLTFTDYDVNDVVTLVNFFNSLKGSKSFYWTPPDSTLPQLWKQDGQYDVSYNGPLTRSFSVTIKRVYTA